MAEVSTDLAPHEAVTECERYGDGDRDTVAGVEGDVESVIPACVLQRPPKIHWKRRPYHRQLPTTGSISASMHQVFLIIKAPC